MSNIVKFFVATNDGAVDSLRIGPDSSLHSITFGNFDAEEAILDWEARLTGIPFDSLVESDLPEVVEESDGGALVLRLSEALVDSLDRASASQILDLASWWASEEKVGKIELAAAAGILQGLVELIREERRSGMFVYCWTS
ncbi:hypothetical protein [Streptomyces sp. NBC_01483]|uniref:hypothetical protein n=1 Tax=Streptomyces sp. NBC_01483 TaxID=2903883 RepID=UPI002E3070AF|nr:hypothetical protein [Streptomyces sp. NBC_01483]